MTDRLLSKRISTNRRGVALMLVLWLVVVLGVIAASVVATARAGLNTVTALRARTAARYAAESGVVAATARLADLLQAARTPDARLRVFRRLDEVVSAWGERAFGPARYQVAVADVGARIDLNQADEQVLLGLFRQFVDEDRAAALVDALQDWKDEDDEPRPQGAEAQDYDRMGSLFVPPNAPLLRLDEVRRINGFGDSLAGVLAPYITVSGTGVVNANSAPQVVLAALPELGPVGAELIVAGRARGEFVTSVFETLQEMRQRAFGRFVPGAALTTLPERLLVVSRGWVAGQPLTHEVQAVLEIVEYSGVTGPSLRIVSWTERDL